MSELLTYKLRPIARNHTVWLIVTCELHLASPDCYLCRQVWEQLNFPEVGGVIDYQGEVFTPVLE